ncbi:MAG: amidase [Azospirillaceae bacterium]
MLDRPLAERPLGALTAALEAGRASALDLAEAALAAVEAAGPAEAGRIYLGLEPEQVRAQARAADALRVASGPSGPLAGLPIAIKDLFDVAGEVTRAGSVALDDAASATATAPAIARLAAAGAVIVGRTNMTEFAFSGLGLNPHYGTPGNPHDPSRIPGGSSSGAAVAVGRGMAAAAIGSDTGGSVRIPAALCGLAGFKPSQAAVPRDGALPLSTSLDTVGPIAPSLACCWLLHSVMAGRPVAPLTPRPVDRQVLGVPDRVVLDDAEPGVARVFEETVTRLSAAGARVVDLPAPEFEAALAAQSPVSFAAAEAFAWHAALLDRAGARYDPRVRSRIERGRDARAADYIALLAERRRVMGAWRDRTRDLDAVIAPTVPITAPPLAALEADDDAYHRTNLLVLRNTTLGNLLDTPAASLPCGPVDGLPVGLMVMGRTGHDGTLARVAAGIEAALTVF